MPTFSHKISLDSCFQKVKFQLRQAAFLTIFEGFKTIKFKYNIRKMLPVKIWYGRYRRLFGFWYRLIRTYNVCNYRVRKRSTRKRWRTVSTWWLERIKSSSVGAWKTPSLCRATSTAWVSRRRTDYESSTTLRLKTEQMEW